MAAGRDGDTAVWLHNKLGSTDDLWSGSSICSHLTRERLLSIQECFQHLQPHVKVKLMLSFLHLPKRSVEEWKVELEQILHTAMYDTDQWVAMVGDMLKTFPETGSLNCDVDSAHSFFHEVIGDLKKLVKKSQDTGMLPLECPYLSRNAMQSIAGQQPLPVKHFALKRKPKSAALRADLLQKSVEVANNAKKNCGTTVPVKIRSFAKNMDDTTPLRGIPSSRTPSSGGFIRNSSLAGRFGSSTPLGPNRSSSSHKEGGIKLLDITEQPIGSKEAKRRKKQAAEQEASEQQEKAEAQPAAMPDYAAGLLAPTFNVSNVTGSVTSTSLPSYVPNAGSSITVNAAIPPPSSKVTTSIIQPPVAVAPVVTTVATPVESMQQRLLVQLAAQSSTQPGAARPAISLIQLRPGSTTAPPTTVALPSPLTIRSGQPLTLVAAPTTSGARLNQPGTILVQRPLIHPGGLAQAGVRQIVVQRPVGLQQLRPGQIIARPQPPVQAPVVATNSSQAVPAASVQNQPKKGLSLTKEQMMEAQEMFRTSNKVTRPEKALILGFMAGSRDNPCPNQGDIINIRLSETVDTVQTPEGIFRPMIVETYFQMNYATGESKRITKMREIETEAE